MSTVREALDMLNETLHKSEYHAEMVRMELMPEEMAFDNTPHDLMKQTYDWRYEDAGITKPDKDEYTVKLTADNVRYIGRAIEVYEKFLSELWVKPALKRIVTKLGEVSNGE